MEDLSERWIVGLMSGTSLDGVDAALLRSDGERVLGIGPSLTFAYDPEFRAALRACLGGRRNDPDAVAAVEAELTQRHAAAVDALLEVGGLPRSAVGLVGFHGQTLLHAPQRRHTWQIGDGASLARQLGLPVVNDFRSADVAEGGQGAPLVPVFHRALAGGLERPLALLNIGGVANVTWIGPGEADLLACDTGPGNALLDDWILRHTGEALDWNGGLSTAGRVRQDLLERLLAHPFFAEPPPKSLDRDAFDVALLERLPVEDGAATLAAFTVDAVARIVPLLPTPPRRWLVCGGGRHNRALMRGLAERLGVPVEPVEVLGWNGDALEAQAFAFLAARSVRGLPLSYPGTTGVPRPMPGGRLHLP